jgi:hypothetical protein
MFQPRLVVDSYNDNVLGLILQACHLVQDIVVPIFGGIQPSHMESRFHPTTNKDYEKQAAEEFSMHCYRQ